MTVAAAIAFVCMMFAVLRRRDERRWRRALDGQSGAERRSWLRSTCRLLSAARGTGNDVLRWLDRELRVGCGADAVLVLAPSGEELHARYHSGDRMAHFHGLRLRLDDARLPAAAARERHRVVAPSGGDSLLPTDRFAVAVPLLDGARLLAVAYASSIRDGRPDDVEAVVQAAEHAAPAYAIALEREADRVDAAYDQLTGLLTPRAFRRRLQEEIVRGSVAGRNASLCLWFVDTDAFKTINDTLGHAAGDAVLRTMASLLEAQLVAHVEVAGRNGGDEFCALLHDGKARGLARAQAFCDAVRAHDFGIPARVTASVGVAVFPYDAAEPARLLECADAAMYHAKRSGRDRVAYACDNGTFACAGAEAASRPSRSSRRWGPGEYSTRPSSP
jgi:diguanylate cyclase (GGDEF)-like protein